MHDPEWTALVSAFWRITWLRTKHDADLAAGEIARAFSRRPPDNAELCSVARWLSGPDGHQNEAPTLRQFIRAAAICRKAARLDTGTAPDGECGCAACHGGLVRVFKGPAGMTFDESLRAESTTVPCICRSGDLRRLEYKPWREASGRAESRLRAMANLGAKQRASIYASVGIGIDDGHPAAVAAQVAADLRDVPEGVTEDDMPF